MNGNDRAIVGVTTLGHGMVHMFELSIPVLLPIWMRQFDVGAATMGLVVTAGYAAFGVGALPGGILADRYDARTLIAACLVGMGAAFLAVSVSPNVAVLAVALFLWGASASVYHPSGLSLISKGVEARGRGFAYHGMAGNLGTAVGPLVTVLLLVWFDWTLVAGVLATFALVGGALAFRVDVDETAAVDGARADGSGERGVESVGEFVDASRRLFAGGFAVVFVAVVFEGLFYRGALTFLPGLLDGLSAVDDVVVAGRTIPPSRYVYTGLLVVGMVGQYVAGSLTDRIRPLYGLTAVFACLAVVSLLFVPAAGFGLVGLVVVSALLGVLLFGEQPFMQATVAEYSRADVRGLTYGFTYLGAFGVGALGATLTGVTLARFSFQTLFVLLAGLAAAAAVSCAVLLRR